MSPHCLSPERKEHSYQIWECSQPTCGLRFPVLDEEIERLAWNGTCPRCGASVMVMGRYPCGGGENTPFSVKCAALQEASIVRPLRALLDNVRSTWNVGSMLRTADGVAMEQVYLCGITPPGDHPKAATAALGAERSVPWSQHANGLHLCMELKNEGWQLWVLESAMDGYDVPIVSIFDRQPTPLAEGEKVLLIAGNERTGVDAHILTICDRILTIPMLGRKGSLNVAVAFGIAAYCLRFP